MQKVLQKKKKSELLLKIIPQDIVSTSRTLRRIVRHHLDGKLISTILKIGTTHFPISDCLDEVKSLREMMQEPTNLLLVITLAKRLNLGSHLEKIQSSESIHLFVILT